MRWLGSLCQQGPKIFSRDVLAATMVPGVKRLVVLGLLFGVSNGVAAAATLYGLYVLTPEVETFGYFGSAPFGDVAYESSLDIYYDGIPWEYAAVPGVLILLNLILLPLAVRRGWLRP